MNTASIGSIDRLKLHIDALLVIFLNVSIFVCCFCVICVVLWVFCKAMCTLILV